MAKALWQSLAHFWEELLSGPWVVEEALFPIVRGWPTRRPAHSPAFFQDITEYLPSRFSTGSLIICTQRRLTLRSTLLSLGNYHSKAA